MSVPIEQTVTKLFGALESRQIRYAVLRNYELFPTLRLANSTAPHTDIDLVVDSRDLAEFRAILAAIAEEDCWDVLTECDHWAQSKFRAHNIEVFRFCRVNPLEYLQVDVFHGVLIWGLALLEEKQMLAGRIYDFERGLTRIDPIKENLHRMLQIHGLFPGSRKKRKRYREKLLMFRAENRDLFDRSIEETLSRYGVEAIHALERNDTRSFRRYMSLARSRFVLTYAARHTSSVVSCFYQRLVENIRRYYTRPCGAVIRTAVRDETQRQLVREIMDELVRNSFMDEWREHDEGARLSLSDYKEMEQGALIIEWNTNGRAELDLRAVHERNDLVNAILNVAAHHHKCLYVRSCSRDSSVAAEASAS